MQPRRPAAAMPMMAASSGYCETTTVGEGDCIAGDKGSWPLSPAETRNHAAALRSCTHRCTGCPRCAFISVSRRFFDCSWFARCELGALKREPGSFKTYAMNISRSPAQPVRTSWADGFCGATVDGESNDCARDDLGSFGLKPHQLVNWSMAWTACTRHCLGCARCQYITVSLSNADCSWYASCNMRHLSKSPFARGFRTRRVRRSVPHRLPEPTPLYEPPSGDATAAPTCSIYVHDPGARYNIDAMLQPGQRWSDTDHNWHVAMWLHRALLNYEHRTHDPRAADVIYLAHYFLTENPIGLRLRRNPDQITDGLPMITR